MKNYDKHSRLNWRIAATVFVMLAPCFSFAQVRIDWQQCYGNEGSTDYASSIAPAKDGFIVVGQIEKPLHQGLCSCAVNDLSTPWMIQIDNQGEMEWQ